MSQEWMIDVLTDLKQFAKSNGLIGLAEQLDDTILVAVTEMNVNQQSPVKLSGDTNTDHGVHRTLATSDNI